MSSPIHPRPDILTDALGALDLQRRITEHPYQTLLVAAGVGYVLGGGLFTRLSARVAVMAVRAAVLPLLQQGVLTAVDALGTEATKASA